MSDDFEFVPPPEPRDRIVQQAASRTLNQGSVGQDRSAQQSQVRSDRLRPATYAGHQNGQDYIQQQGQPGSIPSRRISNGGMETGDPVSNYSTGTGFSAFGGMGGRRSPSYESDRLDQLRNPPLQPGNPPLPPEPPPSPPENRELVIGSSDSVESAESVYGWIKDAEPRYAESNTAAPNPDFGSTWTKLIASTVPAELRARLIVPSFLSPISTAFWIAPVSEGDLGNRLGYIYFVIIELGAIPPPNPNPTAFPEWYILERIPFIDNSV